jgi:hypothetical protein
MVKNIKGGYIIKKLKVLIKKNVVLKVHKFLELRSITKRVILESVNVILNYFSLITKEKQKR